MHCLPAHRGAGGDHRRHGRSEIDRVYDIAENRLHVQKAIMAMLSPVHDPLIH